jgi:hypothetical protein
MAHKGKILEAAEHFSAIYLTGPSQDFVLCGFEAMHLIKHKILVTYIVAMSGRCPSRNAGKTTIYNSN